jgi:hypothetical protein
MKGLLSKPTHSQADSTNFVRSSFLLKRIVTIEPTRQVQAPTQAARIASVKIRGLQISGKAATAFAKASVPTCV